MAEFCDSEQETNTSHDHPLESISRMSSVVERVYKDPSDRNLKILADTVLSYTDPANEVKNYSGRDPIETILDHTIIQVSSECERIWPETDEEALLQRLTGMTAVYLGVMNEITQRNTPDNT